MHSAIMRLTRGNGLATDSLPTEGQRFRALAALWRRAGAGHEL